MSRKIYTVCTDRPLPAIAYPSAPQRAGSAYAAAATYASERAAARCKNVLFRTPGPVEFTIGDDKLVCPELVYFVEKLRVHAVDTIVAKNWFPKLDADTVERMFGGSDGFTLAADCAFVDCECDGLGYVTLQYNGLVFYKHHFELDLLCVRVDGVTQWQDPDEDDNLAPEAEPEQPEPTPEPPAEKKPLNLHDMLRRGAAKPPARVVHTAAVKL